MAETTVLEINFGDTLNEIVSLKDATAGLVAQNKELKKAIEGDTEALNKYGGSVEAAKKQLVQNEIQVKANNKEVAAMSKVVADSTKANNANTGSLEKNKATLAALEAQYAKLSKPTAEQTKRLKDLREEVRNQETAIGKGLTPALEHALRGVKLFGVDVGGLADKLKSTRAALIETRQRLMDVQGGLGGASGAAEGANKGFLSMAKGALTGGNAMKVLKIAFAGLGIGLIIAAVGLLVSALKRFEPVTDRIEQVVSALSAAFDAVAGGVTNFISALASGKNIFSAASDSFGNMGGKMLEAASSAAALTKATQELEDAVREQQLTNVIAEGQIDKLIIQAKDRTKTDEERLQLLAEANKLEAENFQQQLALAKEAERIANEEFQRAKKNQLDEDEFRQKFIDAAVKRQQLENQSANLREKLANRTNALNDEIAEREQKAAEKAREITRQRIQDIQALEKAVSDLSKTISAAPIENQEVDINIAPQIDIPKLEEQIQEVRSRFQNIMQDEEGSSLFDALGISELTEEKIGFAFDAASQLVDGLANIAAVRNQNVLAELDERKAAELQAVEDSTASEEDKAERIEAINEKFNAQRLKQEKEYARKQKAVQIVQAIINGALAVTNALATTQPFIPLGVAAAALAATTTAVQVGVIAGQKLAEGGEVNVGGKPHSQGGTTYVGEDGNAFEVERGEKIFVLKKTASEYIDKYSALNQMFGGKSWNQKSRYHALGGQVAQPFDGGLVPRESLARVTDQNRILNLPALIVQVSEINRVQRNTTQTVVVSEL